MAQYVQWLTAITTQEQQREYHFSHSQNKMTGKQHNTTKSTCFPARTYFNSEHSNTDVVVYISECGGG